MAAQKRILVVLGTRPEAIKLAPVIRELRSRPGQQTYVCLTGQHAEMVANILSFFRIDSDADLHIMQPNQSLSGIASRALAGIDGVLTRIEPEWTLVQGDTTTAFAAALASYHRRVKVGHVEAGLRSHDRFRPYPEEAYRVMTAAVTDLHFCPTERARQNLLAEHVAPEGIRVVGNTVIDALHQGLERLDEEDGVASSLSASFPGLRLDDPFVLVTGHRRESFGKPFQELLLAIRDVAEMEDVQFVYPVHLNPNVRSVVLRELGGVDRIHLVNPLAYVDLIRVLRRSYLVLTDSGGIQEEAPSFRKPVLVLRETTERPELIEAGLGRVVGTSASRILAAATSLLSDEAAYRRMSEGANPFGDGFAARRIADILEQTLGSTRPLPVEAAEGARTASGRTDPIAG
jgi:UDP-N-acetylglucosamine 2-epimerase (non-hydrolysing)